MLNCIDQIQCLFWYRQKLINSDKPLRNIKLHLIRHIVDWVEYLGTPLGFDTERMESYLRRSGKYMYRTGLKRRDDIEEHMTDRVRFLSLLYPYFLNS